MGFEEIIAIGLPLVAKIVEEIQAAAAAKAEQHAAIIARMQAAAAALAGDRDATHAALDAFEKEIAAAGQKP